MFGSTEITILLTALLVMVFAGVHIAIALGMASVLGIYLMQGNMDATAPSSARTNCRAD